MTVIIFLVVLAVLIFVHEFGHFLFARLNKIRVDEFKIGFGPRLFSWTRGETNYGVNLIPFGGYVKIFGENPDEESMNGPEKARSFVHKNRWRQASVLIAGVLFNFLFAWLLYCILFTSGVTIAKDSFPQYAEQKSDSRIIISNFVGDSAAQEAGLRRTDVIKNVRTGSGGIADNLTVDTIRSMIASSSGQVLSFEIERSGDDMVIPVTPKFNVETKSYVAGIYMEDVVTLKLPVVTAVIQSTKYTPEYTWITAQALYGFFADIFQGEADFSEVSGPVGIAGIVGDAYDNGLNQLLLITAIISINLAVINLIPFPALDGGRILFVAIEGIIRRRIPVSVANTLNAIGFTLLMILIVLVTYKDIVKLIK